MSHGLTQAELDVIDLLAESWNAFCALPVEHQSDPPEFCHIIHDAQAGIMARPARRELAALP